MSLAASPGREPQSWSERAGRRLEKALGYWVTWVALFFFVLVAAIIAGYATYKANPDLSGWAGWAAGVSPFVLGATLLAVLWYSLETRRLVQTQWDAAEITDHPGLHVAGWPSEEILTPDKTSRMGGVSAHLPIENVGRTPALVRNISVDYEPQRGSADCEIVRGGDANPRALAPGQQFVVKIIELRFQRQILPPPVVRVSVSISYQTIYGGTGRIVLQFRYGNFIWKSSETHYECTLSSGLRLPRA